VAGRKTLSPLKGERAGVRGEVVVALSTVPSQAIGRKIARALVSEGLCACVNVVPGVRSIYRWKGKLCDEGEELLVIKLPRAKLKALAKRLPELHPYEVPELVAVPVVGGYAPYLEWVRASTP
jgi:periplasmic divalent cation tolerance protein